MTRIEGKPEYTEYSNWDDDLKSGSTESWNNWMLGRQESRNMNLHYVNHPKKIADKE